MTQDYNTLHDQIHLERIRQLEEAVMTLSEDIQSLGRSVRELQKIVSKLAVNQNHITERVASWPYVKVPEKKRRPDTDADL